MNTRLLMTLHVKVGTLLNIGPCSPWNSAHRAAGWRNVRGSASPRNHRAG
jgi:hypothetical protein